MSDCCKNGHVADSDEVEHLARSYCDEEYLARFLCYKDQGAPVWGNIQEEKLWERYRRMAREVLEEYLRDQCPNRNRKEAILAAGLNQ